jgi:hypothetical protein
MRKFTIDYLNFYIWERALNFGINASFDAKYGWKQTGEKAGIINITEAYITNDEKHTEFSKELHDYVYTYTQTQDVKRGIQVLRCYSTHSNEQETSSQHMYRNQCLLRHGEVSRRSRLEKSGRRSRNQCAKNCSC